MYWGFLMQGLVEGVWALQGLRIHQIEVSQCHYLFLRYPTLCGCGRVTLRISVPFRILGKASVDNFTQRMAAPSS